jgi:hypothetical protein
MNVKRLVCPFALALGFVAIGASAWGATPWGGLFSSRTVDADPEKAYKLSEENGPWMIMTCSFSGDGAENQARELAIELRKRYKLESYIHKVRFELGEAPTRGIDRFGEPRRGRYRPGSEIEEYAVLVGNYQTVDDPEAQRVLQKIKFARPECLELAEGKSTHQTLAGWRMIQKQVQEALGSERKARGPMGHAMVTTNPLLPQDYHKSPGVDAFVLGINRDVRYCLLDCPGKYSVQVAQFTGEVIIDQKKINSGEVSASGSKLAEAGDKAEKLTEALRLLGYEAFCLHDRYASIVCVGSFDSVGTPRSDGKIEINPQVHRIIEVFRAQAANIPTHSGAMLPKQLAGINFDLQPVPVEVPKRSIGSAYSRSMLTTR